MADNTSYSNYSGYFNPHISFFNLPIVRNTGWAFLITFLIIWGIIVYFSNLTGEFDLSFNGFNQALEYFKFPLGFLALIIPVGAVYAANHRSEQMKLQITLTQNQNLFVNYYKHIEEFEKFVNIKFDKLFAKNHIYDIGKYRNHLDIRHLHRILYPTIHRDGNLNVNTEVLKQMESIGDDLFQLNEEHQTLENLKSASEKALLELDDLLREYDIDVGGWLKNEHDNKIVAIENYRTQQESFGEVGAQRIARTENCYFVADAILRFRLAVSIISECSKFDTSFTEHYLVKGLKRSIDMKVFSSITGEQEPIDPFITLSVIKPLQNDSLMPLSGEQFLPRSFDIDRFEAYLLALVDIVKQQKDLTLDSKHTNTRGLL